MRLLKIGRDAACDITINSSRVSSLHAELTLLNSGDILLEDKGSKNGTFVQNQPIQPGKTVSVRRGDTIRFADVELQWSQVPMEDNSGYKGVWGIGTNFHNDFQIAGNTVSRFHATVKQANDGKFYIFDHSKNGTTVNGQKIMPNQPFRIKKSSAVSCGGVPVNLTAGNKIPWPSNLPLIILSSAASILLLCCLGYGVWKLVGNEPEPKIDGIATGLPPAASDTTNLVAKNTVPKVKEYTDTELYDMYNHSVVMLISIYHYEAKVEGISDGDMKIINSWLSICGEEPIPEKFLPLGSKLVPVSDMTPGEYVRTINELTKGEGLMTGTGFFVSENGKIITNLHVINPWVFNDDILNIQTDVKRKLAVAAKNHENDALYPYLIAGMTDVKVKGVLDYIALVPQGETFDEKVMETCNTSPLSLGDKKKDVAVIQTMKKRLPTSECTYVPLNAQIEKTPDSLKVGTHIYTMGFPAGNALQQEARGDGIKVIPQDGAITQVLEFEFLHNAASEHGASGSPIFNKYGKLIGILNKGYEAKQGYNFGVKAQYIKEVWDKARQ